MSGHLMLLTIIVLVLDVPRTSRLGLYLSIGDIAAREAENQAHWKQTVSKISAQLLPLLVTTSAHSTP